MNGYLFISSILSFLLLGNCNADALADLAQTDTLAVNGDYQQAEVIYKEIVTDYAGTNEALEAQKGLTIVYIALERWSDAQQFLVAVDVDTKSQVHRNFRNLAILTAFGN